jgi:hypothetical protein
MDTNAQVVVNYLDSTDQELDLLTRTKNLESRKLREDEE